MGGSVDPKGAAVVEVADPNEGLAPPNIPGPPNVGAAFAGPPPNKVPELVFVGVVNEEDEGGTAGSEPKPPKDILLACGAAG